MKLNQIINVLEQIAPPKLAADWDNVGLLIGDAKAQVKKIMLCIDLTQEVLAEAIKAKADMVLAYHPTIFKPISRITDSCNPVVLTAARKHIAVYSLHTALDAAVGGTNDVLADALGIVERRALEPIVREDECKIVVFTPAGELSTVADAAFASGAGRIGNYSDCAFFCHGVGTFRGGPAAKPTIGQVGHQEFVEEMRLEIIAPKSKASTVCEAIRLAHSYEEPAIDIYPLESHPADVGMGRVGRLQRAVSMKTLVSRVKKALGVKNVLLAESPAQAKGKGRAALVNIAACGAGSCGSLWKAAVVAGAGFYLTGEMRHHDALASTASGLTVLCACHSNTERIALGNVAKNLTKRLDKVRVVLSKTDRDPFNIV